MHEGQVLCSCCCVYLALKFELLDILFLYPGAESEMGEVRG